MALDLTSHSPEVVATINKSITESEERLSIRHLEAVRMEVHVLAQLIADCVVDGLPVPSAWSNGYLYARDLSAHVHGQAESVLARIDAPAKAGA